MNHLIVKMNPKNFVKIRRKSRGVNAGKFLIVLLFFLVRIVAAQDNADPLKEVLWYIGFGVGLILLAFVSETVYKVFSSLYGGGADFIPTGGKIDYKAELRAKRKIMGQIGTAEKQRVDDWERAQMAQMTKKLFRLMLYKNHILLNDAAKELGVDIVSLSQSAFELKRRGMIEISGDRTNPNLKATKLLFEKVKQIKF